MLSFDADMYFTHGIRMPWINLQYTTLLMASLTKYMIDVQQQVQQRSCTG